MLVSPTTNLPPNALTRARDYKAKVKMLAPGIYLVTPEGRSIPYTVRHDAEGWRCNCAATTFCRHLPKAILFEYGLNQMTPEAVERRRAQELNGRMAEWYGLIG